MKKSKIFYGWWIVIGAVVLTSTLVPGVVAMANKFLIPVTEDMGISRSAFTLSNTILQAMGIFLSPIAAKKITTGNLRNIQSTAIVIFTLAYASYGLAKSPIHLYISSFIIGICYLFSTIIPISIVITNWFEKKRGLAMSIAMTGIGIGGAILSPLITFFLEKFGWRTSYMLLAGIFLLIALPISLFVFKKKPEDMGLQPYGANEELNTGQENKKVFKTETVNLPTKSVFGKPFFIILLIGMVLNGIINSGALGQFPPALEGLQGGQIAAAVISLYSLVGIGGKLLVGWINDRWGAVVSSIFGCGAFGLAFVFMLFGDKLFAVYAMAIVFGLGIAIGSVSPPLVTSAIFGTEQYGEVYGYVSSAIQIGMSVGSLFVASMYDATGSYQVAWIILLILTACTLMSWMGAYYQSRKYCQGTVEAVSAEATEG
ncbi:MFS transporter [Vagococcus sp. BWB3-3]|uniref:MFS transporter n=1 Tax=Vagococcus allomyrinae TaxID=2794353 RepID=A0A940SX39_9ENTE|nr:MFS transporter [Vagococcus allomyrinae]MBP1043920.1 MFS transporter [Vagococcus allomyrinae]